MLAWRSMGAAARERIERNGPTAAVAATVCRNFLREKECRASAAGYRHCAAHAIRWYETSRSRLDIRRCLKALTAALADADDRVRALAAQAIGAIDAEASSALCRSVRTESS